MSAQLPPVPSQRLHWYLKVIGVVPVQVPSVVVRVCPSVGVPEIVGGAVFVGLSFADAWPLLAWPKIAPIARAASASSTILAARFRVSLRRMSAPWSVMPRRKKYLTHRAAQSRRRKVFVRLTFRRLK